MKRYLLLALCVALLGLAYVPAYAETQGSATASVIVTINPNVAVGVLSPIVDAGTVQMGPFVADLRFRIDANTEAVKMFLEGSSLYKGDDPLNTEVAPIAILISKPVAITPQFGNRMGALPNEAAWVGAGTLIGAYPTIATETVEFESSQNGHYSQDVGYRVTYTQPDPEKPQGQYSGKVRLTVLL